MHPTEASAINYRRLYIASCLALATAAIAFSIRADIMDALAIQFAVPKESIGEFAAMAFLGLAVANLFGSPLCDSAGMGALLRTACGLHCAGIAFTVFAPNFVVLKMASLIMGLAHGLVEASINPLTAVLYPSRKTQKLNELHAWWPAGLIIGGLLSYLMTRLGFWWQLKTATILLPAFTYGVMTLGQSFPCSERVQHGVSTKEMVSEAFRPMFLILSLCMLVTASSELGPSQWMESVIRKTAGIPGILVLVYVSSLMFVLRMFTWWVARWFSPVSLMILSCLLTALGLLALSFATTPITVYAAATVFGIGVCYCWPTMLALVSELFPKGGPFLMGLMGTAGYVSVYLVLPLMGRSYDQQGAELAFRWVALAPGLLVIVFGLMLAHFKARGGYQPVQIETLAVKPRTRPKGAGA